MKKSGFTLVEIMIVVAIIGLLAAIAIPSFMKARTTAQKNACINNLVKIDGAKDQLAMDTGLKNGDTAVDTDIESYLKKKPTCPVGNSDYTYNVIGTDPVCANVGDLPEHVIPQ